MGGLQLGARLRTGLDTGKADFDLHLAVTAAAELHIQRQLCLLHLEPQLLAGPVVLRGIQLTPQLHQRFRQRDLRVHANPPCTAPNWRPRKTISMS